MSTPDSSTTNAFATNALSAAPEINAPVATRQKKSYTVPCSTAFRDAVTALAERKHSNVADIARSVLLLIAPDVINALADPGGPENKDRESIVIKSGRAEGKPWRRKPRLQVRLGGEISVPTIRKALSLALASDRGDVHVGAKHTDLQHAEDKEHRSRNTLLREALDEMERLRNVIGVLHFDVLQGGVYSRDQALYVLGFAPSSDPERAAVRSRFRRLATIYHPDSKDGSHQRMSQLNAAMEILRP